MKSNKTMEQLLKDLNKAHASKKKERKNKMAQIIKEQISQSHIRPNFLGNPREKWGRMKPGIYKVRIYKFDDRGKFIFVTLRVTAGECKNLMFLEAYPMPVHCGEIRSGSEENLAKLIMVSNLDMVLDIEQLGDIKEYHIEYSSDFFVRIGKTSKKKKCNFQIRDYFLDFDAKRKRSNGGYFTQWKEDLKDQ